MKLIVLTFGGRECSLRILFPLILKYKKYIHEFRLYIATVIQSDIDYMEKFAQQHDFVKTIYLTINGKKITDNSQKELIWNNAYESCQEDDTVYLKMDDDITYFDETLFTDFINYRTNNCTAPILFPIIINNSTVSNILQENNIYNPREKSNMLYSWKNTYNRIKSHVNNNKLKRMRICDFVSHTEILCPIAWGNLQYCYDLHSQFLNDINNGDIKKYYLKDNIVLQHAEPISINVCSWLGSDLKKYTQEYGNVYCDENYLTVYLPIWSNFNNEIYSRSVVAHYAYYKQRELGLDNTDILERYYEYVINNN